MSGDSPEDASGAVENLGEPRLNTGQLQDKEHKAALAGQVTTAQLDANKVMEAAYERKRREREQANGSPVLGPQAEDQKNEMIPDAEPQNNVSDPDNNIKASTAPLPQSSPVTEPAPEPQTERKGMLRFLDKLTGKNA